MKYACVLRIKKIKKKSTHFSCRVRYRLDRQRVPIYDAGYESAHVACVPPRREILSCMRSVQSIPLVILGSATPARRSRISPGQIWQIRDIYFAILRVVVKNN